MKEGKKKKGISRRKFIATAAGGIALLVLGLSYHNNNNSKTEQTETPRKSKEEVPHRDWPLAGSLDEVRAAQRMLGSKVVYKVEGHRMDAVAYRLPRNELDKREYVDLDRKEINTFVPYLVRMMNPEEVSVDMINKILNCIASIRTTIFYNTDEKKFNALVYAVHKNGEYESVGLRHHDHIKALLHSFDTDKESYGIDDYVLMMYEPDEYTEMYQA